MTEKDSNTSMVGIMYITKMKCTEVCLLSKKDVHRKLVYKIKKIQMNHNFNSTLENHN